MKKIILFSLMSCSLSFPSIVYGQQSSEKIKKEITQTLDSFYTAARKANTEGIMSLFDNSSNIIFIGGDSAEIWKGATKIRAHLNSMFPGETVALLMDRTDIDYNQNTAWVFADGKIIIAPTKGDPINGLYRFTAILIKRGNAWKFRLYNGSNPKGK